MPNPEDPVAVRLESDRKALLDLSLRNPLLNYRPRARSLEIVGESPEQVSKCLVRDARRMTFLPAPDKPIEPEADAPSPPPPITDQADHKLQTALDAEALAARLLAIYYAARTSIEEQGVNTLFLALGMLRWVEPGRDGGPLRAPLILIPVELERSSVRERFRLRHSGGDLETNLSLVEKLRADFKIELPEVPDANESEITKYLDVSESIVADHPGWAVERDAIVLGFFSFGKFLMYRDLDPEVWPERARAEAHPVVAALLRDGFVSNEPATQTEEDEAATLDDVAPPDRAGHVLDADATQALALLDVSRGKNLVIQGPPGTGKSQTIANLIASAIARGQTVLFVAEKLAALDVVKRRLDASGLGDACLELHSHKTSKRTVLDELQRTLRLGRPRLGAADDEAALLKAMRDRLNAYSSAVHRPVGASGISPFQAVGTVLSGGPSENGNGPPPPIDLPGWSGWSPLERKTRLALVAEVEASLGPLGVPSAHPFWGTRKTTWLPDDSAKLRERMNAAVQATARLGSASTVLAEFLRVAPPRDRAGCVRVLLAARRASSAGKFLASGADISNPDWLARRGELNELVMAVHALDDIHRALDEKILPETWSEDLSDARRELNLNGRHWWRFALSSYRAAAKKVDGLYRGAAPATIDERIAMADAVMSAHRLREIVRKHEPLAARLFGNRWQGERSSWESLALLAKWGAKLHHDLRTRRLPDGFHAFLQARPSLGPLGGLVNELKAALGRHHDAVSALSALLDFEPPNGSRPLLERPFEEQSALWKNWTEHAGYLPALTATMRLLDRCRAEGLAPVAALAASWPGAARGLTGAVERAGASGVLAEAFRDRPSLSGFDATGHERTIGSFVELDRAALRHNRVRAALAHWERLPRSGGGGQMGILRRDFEKKSRHLPVRQLLARAGNAVQAIKPVFLMSPLSIASYLTPGIVEFDLVVFDEASQVKPVDALGAILRGKQAIVVGDSRQLPPTSFFDRLTSGEDFDPDDDAEALSDVESILGLFVASGAPERMLRWHYRSRHESLIAVSNRLFYDGRLVVFPSPDAARTDTGLVLRHLPEAVYDRGRSRTNPVEAEAVARAVMEHARAQLALPPESRRTLGVAAFSLSQTSAILEALEDLRRDEPGCEPFFAPGGPEPFFVKNLENVQGDERDVILISIGYGRTSSGDVPMNFGPLNGEGGERRLNVLITRARLRCEVFTNLKASDLDLDRTRSRGVRALKTFLACAETGKLDGDSHANRNGDPAAPGFEQTVREALTAAGFVAHLGVGEEGVAPELAVADPDHPGRDLLGVLSDSPLAYRGRPARDRERLRPQVLESLGWRLHRAWSIDWARDPDQARRRLFDALAAARTATATPSQPPVPVPAAAPTEVARDEADPGSVDVTPSRASPYKLATAGGELDLGTAPTAALVRRLVKVVEIEGPIHRDDALRRVAEGAGAKRIGPRAQVALDEAVEGGVAIGKVVAREAFLWPSALKEPVVRDRSELSSNSRRTEFVAPEEYEGAVSFVVADALGMPREMIPPAVARLLGFPRATDDLRTRVEAAVSRMLSAARLAERGENLIVTELK